MRISNAVLGAFAVIAFAGCLADTSEPADEHVGQSGEALSSSGSVVPDEAPPTELPIWHVYLAGRDNQGHVYPDDIDADGHVVAVREADAKGPAKVVHLYLRDHWMGGDKWIEDGIAAGRFTGLDLLVVTSEILKSHGVLLPPPPGILRSTPGTRIDDGGDWNPFPGLPGSSDPHGGPTAGSSNPNRGGGAAHGAGSGGTNGGSHGGGGTPLGRRDPHDEAYRNGVRRGDSYADGSRYPTSYPGIAGYKPRGEKPSLFKCEGTTYYGDKSACPDFAGGSIGSKWGDKLSRWEEKHFDPRNISRLSPQDRKSLCLLLTNVPMLSVCLVAAAGCVAGEVVTVGSITIPCTWAWGALCAGHGLLAIENSQFCE